MSTKYLYYFIYKNIPEIILDGDTKDNKIDDICNDLSKMKLKKIKHYIL